MCEAEKVIARWILDSAAALHLPPYFFNVKLKAFKKEAMAIRIKAPYLAAEVWVDPSALKGSHLTRLYLAHELGHVWFHTIGTQLEADAEELACDWFAALVVGLIPEPPEEILVQESQGAGA